MSNGNSLTIKAGEPDTWKKDDETTWGNKFLIPGRPLNQRQKELCRLAALGKTNNEIAAATNYHYSRVSILLTSDKIQDEIERYKDKLFKVDEQARLKELAPDALDVMETILMNPKTTPEDKESAARWVLEKVTGKAAQAIDVKDERGLHILMDKLDQMKAQNKSLPSPDIIDVVAKEPSEEKPKDLSDTFETWIKENV